jgi:ABC-type transport system involved in multi-copper enzyme maturation permease subunit
MTLLPIVQRELRVAARKRSTFWLRVIAAVVALILGTGWLLMFAAMGGGRQPMFSAGKILFGILTWMGLVCVLFTGLFFTSDCISEEKRDGTLGLLFLTDLRGYDVIAGKLFANSVRGFFALLAVFPVLGLTLLMGGVTLEQFTLTCVALTNALIFSLMAGVVISVFGREAPAVLSRTFLLLLFVVFAGPGGDRLSTWVHGASREPFWSYTSPGYLFLLAGQPSRGFWAGLLVNQVSIWVLFALSCRFVPRVWQSGSRKAGNVAKGWSYRLKYGSPTRRLAIRRRLLGKNPVLWLTCRERWQSVAAWTVAVLSAAGFGLALGMPTGAWFAASYVVGALSLVLYLWVASYSSRLFSEARRTGITELLLVGPLNEQKIVEGQWFGLLRLFGAPVLVIVAVSVGTTVMGQGVYRQMFNQVGINQTIPIMALYIAGSATAVLTTLGNLTALAWVGMWMGLNSRTANLATVKTLVLVEVVPWFVIAFGAGMSVPLLILPALLAKASTPQLYVSLAPFLGMVVSATLALGKNIFFVLWARKKLYLSFRTVLSQTYLPGYVPPVVRTWPAQPPIVAPPVMPTR